MYPGVIVEYDDQSDISSPVTTSEVRNVPLFGAVFTSDKGPEEWTRVSGEDFFKKYGKTISFAKHGQPLLQAAMTINAGGELLCKRLVADDAKLANLGIVANVKTVEGDQATDEEGNLIYIDDEGNDTTTVTDTPKPGPSIVSVRFSTISDPDAKSIKEAKEHLLESLEESKTEGEKSFLLYVIGDVGRGISKKNIKIIPNYRLSKSLDYVLYTLSVIEDGVELESLSFSINPDIVTSGQNISLSSMINTYSSQISCIASEEGMVNFIEEVANALGLRSSYDLWKYDMLFGKDNKGIAIDGLTIAEGSVELDYSYGQPLSCGDNGSLGPQPFYDDTKEGVAGPIRKEYIKQAKKALSGEYDTSIFNVDHYMITAWVDANYPTEVKNAIAELATFREDFEFFRDMGLGKTNLEQIENANSAIVVNNNMFTSNYCQSYDIIDPYTKKQITVTIGYDLAQLLVAHYNNGISLPTAGMKYGMTIKNAIYGTLSFAPTICPDPEGNQKEKLDDMRVNYASYIDNQLVIESLYTSQNRNSQWSYINNVMAIQEVIKDIRTRCPANRYTFMDGEDLELYKADVEEVLAPYKSQYKSLTLEFKADATYAANKIFYAVLKVVYRDFVQTEWFKVTALNSVNLVEA